jgi:hypothetical protein
MRIRIVQKPPVDDVDGIDLRHFQVGIEYDLGNTLASMLLAERWAEPVPFDVPSPPVPFGPDDPFTMPVIDRNQPPNLVKEHHPPLLDRTIAADLEWPRRRRRQGR